MIGIVIILVFSCLALLLIKKGFNKCVPGIKWGKIHLLAITKIKKKTDTVSYVNKIANLTCDKKINNTVLRLFKIKNKLINKSK